MVKHLIQQTDITVYLQNATKRIIAFFLLCLFLIPLQLSSYQNKADSLSLDSLFTSYHKMQFIDSLAVNDSILLFQSHKIFYISHKFVHEIFDYQNIIRFNQDDTLLAKAIFLCGINLQKQDQNPVALSFFRKTHFLFPKNKYGILALKQVGDIHFKEKKYYLAKSFYWKFVFHNTNMNQKADAFFQIERCKYHIGSYELPTEMFNNYISKFPESPLTPRLCFELSIYYYNIEKKYKSLFELEKIITSYPSVSWMDSVYFQIGLIYNDFEEWNNSIEVITRMIKKYPASPLRKSALDLLSANLLAKNSILDAINKLNSIIYDSPENQRNDYYSILIKLYSKMGLGEEIISIYHLMISNETDPIKQKILQDQLKKIIEKTGHDINDFDLLDTQRNQNEKS
ncbi:MAG: hypothetical protein U9P79_10510 [Candidatus Cloacimonadota bacterium]|nr:hypothetical protein [Candidatus Cloacimonadota bacterium]